jgi:four helix bundle protein
MDLVEVCYRVSAVFPAQEQFGRISQIRRAASSVPANIAEGYGRWNVRDFGRFLASACGSVCELETHLILRQRLGFVSVATVEPLLRSIDELTKTGRRVLANAQASETASRGSRAAENRRLPW